MPVEPVVMAIFFARFRGQRGNAEWKPAVDLYRTARGWVIKCDLAGVALEDVTVESSGSQIRLRGVRRDRPLDPAWKPYSMEISYSGFERLLDLPCDLSHATIERECRDGMLLVHIKLGEVNG